MLQFLPFFECQEDSDQGSVPRAPLGEMPLIDLPLNELRSI